MLTLLCPDTLPEPPTTDPGDDASARAVDSATHPVAGAASRFAPLKQRLRRARPGIRWHEEATIARRSPLESWITQCFGLPAGVWPAAYGRFAGCVADRSANDTGDVCRLAQGQLRSELTIRPAHLHAGLDHLVLQPPAMLEVTTQEAEQLVISANDFLRDDGISLRVLTADYWVLDTGTRFDVDLSSAEQAIGRNVDAYMPAGKDGRKLRSLLNELQMLWHDHPVNQQRDDNGHTRINTVWAEGYCDPLVTDMTTHGFRQIFCTQPAMAGLAQAQGIP
ncbi:MAG: hypothetical protein WA888_15130, partial [Burkholderiaceae bacterium]